MGATGPRIAKALAIIMAQRRELEKSRNCKWERRFQVKAAVHSQSQARLGHCGQQRSKWKLISPAIKPHSTAGSLCSGMAHCPCPAHCNRWQSFVSTDGEKKLLPCLPRLGCTCKACFSQDRDHPTPMCCNIHPLRVEGGKEQGTVC